jgi:hypothetical protein
MIMPVLFVPRNIPLYITSPHIWGVTQEFLKFECTLSSAIQVCGCVHFYVCCFKIVLLLFWECTNLLQWLMWKNNEFASNSVSNSVR